MGLMNTLSNSQGMLFICADLSLSMAVEDLLKSGPFPLRLCAVADPAEGYRNWHATSQHLLDTQLSTFFTMSMGVVAPPPYGSSAPKP